MTAAIALAAATVAAFAAAAIRYCTDDPRPSRRTLHWYSAALTLTGMWATAEAIEAGNGWPRLAVALWMLAAFAAGAVIGAALDERVR